MAEPRLRTVNKAVAPFAVNKSVSYTHLRAGVSETWGRFHIEYCIKAEREEVSVRRNCRI